MAFWWKGFLLKSPASPKIDIWLHVKFKNTDDSKDLEAWPYAKWRYNTAITPEVFKTI